MSTLLATNIQDRATLKSLGIERVIEGSAKAWARYEVPAGIPTISDGFNASSMSDLGIGQHRINHTAGFANPNNCAAFATAWAVATWTNKEVGSYVGSSTQTEVYTTENGASVDAKWISVMALGDLA